MLGSPEQAVIDFIELNGLTRDMEEVAQECRDSDIADFALRYAETLQTHRVEEPLSHHDVLANWVEIRAHYLWNSQPVTSPSS